MLVVSKYLGVVEGNIITVHILIYDLVEEQIFRRKVSNDHKGELKIYRHCSQCL